MMACLKEPGMSRCGLCSKYIPTENLVVHKVHCEKSKICNKCNIRVHVSAFSEHIRNVHELTKCQKCQKQVEVGNMEMHVKNDCLMSTINCEFCEIPLSRRSMPSHVLYCGARTDNCKACGKLVCLKDLSSHKEICPVGDIKKQDKVDIKNYVSKPMLDYYSGCSSIEAKLDELLSITDQWKEPDDPNNLDELEKIPCSYCDKSFMIESFKMHEISCKLKYENDIKAPCEICDALFSIKNLQAHQLTCSLNPESRIDIPCEFCSESFPLESINDHQRYCLLRPKQDRTSIFFSNNYDHLGKYKSKDVMSDPEKEFSRKNFTENSFNDYLKLSHSTNGSKFLSSKSTVPPDMSNQNKSSNSSKLNSAVGDSPRSNGFSRNLDSFVANYGKSEDFQGIRESELPSFKCSRSEISCPNSGAIPKRAKELTAEEKANLRTINLTPEEIALIKKTLRAYGDCSHVQHSTESSPISEVTNSEMESTSNETEPGIAHMGNPTSCTADVLPGRQVKSSGKHFHLIRHYEKLSDRILLN